LLVYASACLSGTAFILIRSPLFDYLFTYPNPYLRAPGPSLIFLVDTPEYIPALAYFS
jgi:hypothetical protein